MKTSMYYRVSLIATIAVIVLLAGLSNPCRAVDGHYEFTASEGYYNGNVIYYLMTGVSDAAYGIAWGVAYTPMLVNALVMSNLSNIYYVTNNPQNLVFTSQWPARYVGTTYVPIWVMWTVTWNPGTTPTELRSFNDINAARRANYITIRRQRIAIGASIIINSLGVYPEQAIVTDVGGHKNVQLPIALVYRDGLIWQMLRLEFQRKDEAMLYGATYAPNLSKFQVIKRTTLPRPWQYFLCTWTRSAVGQLPVAVEYSPLMNEWIVYPPTVPSVVYTSWAQIQAANLPVMATIYFAYEPIIGLAP